jgi:hypothetical protein
MPDEHATHTEPDRVRAKPVLAATIGFTIFAGVCVVVLLAYYNALVGPGLYVPPRPFPEPRLQTTPLSDLEKLQSAQAARIGRYGWIDPGKGLYRIPIQRAMEIVASKGAAALEPLEQAPSPQQSAAELAGQAMRKAGQAAQGGGQ